MADRCATYGPRAANRGPVQRTLAVPGPAHFRRSRQENGKAMNIPED